MKYTNPIIPGFYPDPSICKANGRYYMVCSSFQYFPGVPLFESRDLINWKQIGHVLTRESQLPLKGADCGGGIYAPTIRCHQGRFYMVTTNVTGPGNFYVWTDDIYGEWSEPVLVQQGGIDPSLYFENGKAYFMSNGDDDQGISGVTQCEIDIETGARLSPSVCIWQGTGGRYLESPHLYRIKGQYYLMAAEGGTEYGHMVVYAKGPSVNGPFTAYPGNPVLTNRNLGGYVIQGCGHGDLVEDDNGNFWMVHLAFRQIDQWMTFHITGREVCLVPVTFQENGWFTAGVGGITPAEVETDRIGDSVTQGLKWTDTFSDTSVGVDWVFLRSPHGENYSFPEKMRAPSGSMGQFTYAGHTLKLVPTALTLAEKQDSPTLVAIRQRQMRGQVRCGIRVPAGEAGISLYMDHDHHYDLAVWRVRAAGGGGGCVPCHGPQRGGRRTERCGGNGGSRGFRGHSGDRPGARGVRLLCPVRRPGRGESVPAGQTSDPLPLFGGCGRIYRCYDRAVRAGTVRAKSAGAGGRRWGRRGGTGGIYGICGPL